MNLPNKVFILSIILIIAGCAYSVQETKETAVQPISTNTQKPLTFGLQKGDLAPPYAVMTTEGAILDNGSFSGPVLLYFFATWCPYCKEDFDVLSGVYPEYEDEVSILAIDMDLKEDANLINSYAAKFPALGSIWYALGNPKTLSAYQIKYTTTKYAIDGDGKVIYAGSGAFTEEQWRTLLEAMKNS